jgi:hypothetical protein
MSNPCPTCGRAAHDWKSRPEGTKGQQRQDSEDRALAYRRWHRTLPSWALLSDVDGIEWRKVNGSWQPIAIVELSRIDGAAPLPEAYLKSVETRFNERDAQGDLTRRVATILGVPAYLTLFTGDLACFYVLELTGKGRWAKNLDEPRYRFWLEGLGKEVLERSPRPATGLELDPGTDSEALTEPMDTGWLLASDLATLEDEIEGVDSDDENPVPAAFR